MLSCILGLSCCANLQCWRPFSALKKNKETEKVLLKNKTAVEHRLQRTLVALNTTTKMVMTPVGSFLTPREDTEEPIEFVSVSRQKSKAIVECNESKKMTLSLFYASIETGTSSHEVLASICAVSLLLMGNAPEAVAASDGLAFLSTSSNQAEVAVALVLLY